MKTSVKSFNKIICILLALIMFIPIPELKANAVKKLTASQDCIDLIKETEGFSKYKYWDYSQWTIGYGTGCGADDYPNGITEAEAEKLLKNYVSAFSDCVNNFASKYNITLTQNQFDALVSMSYALGNLWEAYDEFDLKTILINGSDKYSFLEIAKAFGEWRKAGGSVLQGLVKRRELETKLFLKNRTDNTSEVWRVNDESGVNLRSSASASSTKTGFMVMNTIFAVTEKKKGSDGILWGKTQYEGKTHWIALDYCSYMVGGPIKSGSTVVTTTTPASSTDPTQPSTSVVEKWKITSDNGVKLRSGPGTNYSQVGYVPYNAQITVTATEKSGGYLWGKTTYDGTSGWCVLDYAERISNQTLEGTTLKSIYIYRKPDKLEYNEGEQLNTSGLIVKAVYSDNTEKIILDYELSGYQPKEGTYDVKISYHEKTTSFRVTVSGKSLKGIEIVSPPDKTIYKVGEGLAIKGLKVNGIYSNNTEEELKNFYLENVDGFSKTAGKKTITVSANDLTAEFEVEVTDKTLTDIEITSDPTITNYMIGQNLNTDGMIVHAVYSNGTKSIINDYTLSGYNSSSVGPQTVTVNFNGCSDTFDVNVNEPDVYELPGDLDGNGSRDIFDLMLLNKYIDGTCEFESDRIYLADVNLDGAVNEKDVEALSRIVSEQ